MNDFEHQFELSRRASRLKYISHVTLRKDGHNDRYVAILEDIQFNIYIDKRDQSAMCFLRVNGVEDDEIPAYVAYKAYEKDAYNQPVTEVSAEAILVQISVIIDAIKRDRSLAINRMVYFCNGYEIGYNEAMSS